MSAATAGNESSETTYWCTIFRCLRLRATDAPPRKRAARKPLKQTLGAARRNTGSLVPA